MRIEDYLRLVTSQIRCKKACPCVEKELEDHILDQMEAYVKEGMDEEEALDKAVLEMGDPVEVGVELDRLHRPQISWGMVLATGILGMISVLLQYSLQGAGNEMVRPQKQLLFTVLGLLLMIGVYYLDYSILGRYGRQIGAMFLGFMILTIPFRLSVNAASTFIYLGGLVISVPIMMYLYVPIFGGILYSYRKSGYEVLWKIGLWAAIPVWLVLRCPSLVHACFLTLALLIVFTLAVWKDWYTFSKKKVLSMLWGLVAVMPVILLFGNGILAAYQKDRMRAFMDGKGTASYINDMITTILQNCRLWGGSEVGLQVLNSKMPGAQSDFAFVSLVACFGILAGVLVAGLYAGLLWKIFRISKDQHNQLGAIIGCGCGAVFGVQVIYHLLQCLNMLPTASVTLPFLSNSGSGTLVAYMLMGLVLSVYRYKNIPLNMEVRKIPRIRITVE